MLALLEQDIPGISARVMSLRPPQRRLLALAAARLALSVAPMADPRVSHAQAALDFGSDDPVTSEQLQTLVDELDDRASELQVELDSVRDSGAFEREPMLAAAYSRVFAQARACAALVAALDPDLGAAVDAALYEANAALDHAPAAIGALVEAIYRDAPDPVNQVARLLEQS